MTPPAIVAPRLAPGTDGLTTTRHPGRIRLISVRVEDRRGVLQRVTNLLGRRGFGIETCAVGPSAEPGVVAISLRIDAGTQAHDQIVKQLNKLIDVVKILDLSDGSHIERELMLVKVRAYGKDREEMKRMADIFRGRIIDVTEKTYTIELTGPGAKLDAFIEAIDPVAILETVRTGASGIGRGERILKI